MTTPRQMLARAARIRALGPSATVADIAHALQLPKATVRYIVARFAIPIRAERPGRRPTTPIDRAASLPQDPAIALARAKAALAEECRLIRLEAPTAPLFRYKRFG